MSISRDPGILRIVMDKSKIVQTAKDRLDIHKYIWKMKPYSAGPKVSGKFSFLSLPLNVREIVYRHALVPGQVFIAPFSVIRARSGMPEKYLISERAEKPNTSILRTCSHIYKESLNIFLKENNFNIICPYLIDGLDPIIGRRPHRLHALLQRIEDLTIHISSMDYVGYKAYMEQIHTLQIARLTEMIESTPKGTAHRTYYVQQLKKVREMKLTLQRNADPWKKIWTDDEYRHAHDQKIQLCQEKLWGATMAFVRQSMQVRSLTIDIQAAYCPDTCCRMPVEILEAGRFGANAGGSGASGASAANATSSGSGAGGKTGGKSANKTANEASEQLEPLPAFGANSCAPLPKFVSIIGYLSMNEYRAVFAAVVGEKGVRRKKGGSRRLDLRHVSFCLFFINILRSAL